MQPGYAPLLALVRARDRFAAMRSCRTSPCPPLCSRVGRMCGAWGMHVVPARPHLCSHTSSQGARVLPAVLQCPLRLRGGVVERGELAKGLLRARKCAIGSRDTRRRPACGIAAMCLRWQSCSKLRRRHAQGSAERSCSARGTLNISAHYIAINGSQRRGHGHRRTQRLGPSGRRQTIGDAQQTHAIDTQVRWGEHRGGGAHCATRQAGQP